MKNQTKADSATSSNRHGWETLNVNVLLGNDALAHYKADARRRRIKWSDYVAWAIREFCAKLNSEDRLYRAGMKKLAFDSLSSKLKSTVPNLN
jgi:hypothetical protein